jgi:hypothetical protein
VKESRKRMRERKKGENKRKGERKEREKGENEREGSIPQEKRESAAVERPENHPLRAKFENCIGWLL